MIILEFLQVKRHQPVISRLVMIFMMLIALCWAAIPRASAQQDEINWLYTQINSLRNGLGLHGYTLNPQLMSAAQAHSEWMATTGTISHTQSDGSRPADRAAAHGYTGSWVSENIYGGMSASAGHAWNFWMNSEIHYAGITDARKNELGIGVSNGYYTLLFGIGTGVAAPPPVAPPAEPVQPEAPAPAQAPAQAAPPTRIPPTRPPLPTWTPSPTIPSPTPTASWTPTFTWTPSPTATIPPPTDTPIFLPTADLNQLAAIASQLPTATATTTITPSPTASVTAPAIAALPSPLVVTLAADSDLSFEPPTRQPAPQLVATAADESDIDPLKIILPLLILGQMGMIGVAAWWFFWRTPPT